MVGRGELDLIIYESYALRRSIARAMIGNEFETPQVIGVIKWIASQRGRKHTDGEAIKCTEEVFFGDDRLEETRIV